MDFIREYIAPPILFFAVFLAVSWLMRRTGINPG